MKYACIVPDGMADEPLEQLNGRTPLEVADTPNMDALAQSGRVGQVRLIPRGMEPGSDVANMSLMGYDPAVFYTGRAPIEAAALGVALGEGDVAFRCNLVTVVDGQMVDYSAGHISTKEATVLIDLLNEKLGTAEISFHPGVSYRHLTVLRGVGKMDIRTTPPHNIIGQLVKGHLPIGRDSETVLQLMAQAETRLTTHEINDVRRDLGENPTTGIWLWGQGEALSLESFRKRFGINGALISAVDLLKGLAISAGLDVIIVPGATGYLDTDYAAKGKYACRVLTDYDLVMVHVEAPDEAGHEANIDGKIAAIERVDADVVGPVWETLKESGDYRMLVVPDHATPIRLRTHTATPVPFAICGTGVESVVKTTLTEKAGEAADLKIEVGHELMKHLLGK